VDQVYEDRAGDIQESESWARANAGGGALRMLLLKHVRNWSYEVLEREVRANLVYRSFCRIGWKKGTGCQDAGEKSGRPWEPM